MAITAANARRLQTRFAGSLEVSFAAMTRRCPVRFTCPSRGNDGVFLPQKRFASARAGEDGHCCLRSSSASTSVGAKGPAGSGLSGSIVGSRATRMDARRLRAARECLYTPPEKAAVAS
jgi:hypothetical protein